MKKALVYVRIIPDTQGRSKQAQDYTMQIQDLERYCKANNYTVTERFEEKPIGNNKDRNFITSLVQYFENHKDTKYFMAQDINKLGKTWEILPIVETLNNMGVCTIITNINLTSLNEDGSINEKAMQMVLNLSESEA